MWPAWCCARRSAARWSPMGSATRGPSTGPRAGSARSASRSRSSRRPRAPSWRSARAPPSSRGQGRRSPRSAVVGTMAVAARSVHVKNGFFITAEGYEYVLNLSAASVALAAIGPGAAWGSTVSSVSTTSSPRCSAPSVLPLASAWPPRRHSSRRSGNARRLCWLLGKRPPRDRARSPGEAGVTG